MLAAQGIQAQATLPAPALISPANGVEMHGYPRIMNFQWSPVTGAESYSIEIDCLGCCDRQTWCSNNGRTGYIVRGLEVPGFTFSFWGDQPGKWRVWANTPSGDGNVS